jgi:hypothetical protein
MKTRCFLFLSLIISFFIPFSLTGQSYLLNSPDGSTGFHITAGENIEYQVLYKSIAIIEKSGFAAYIDLK